MVTIQIKTKVIEWLSERLDLDADEALELAREFVGMLYFTGAFSNGDEQSASQPPAADVPDAASIKARWG